MFIGKDLKDDQLEALVSRDGATSEAQAQLTELAHAVRAFAYACPDEYRLIFAPTCETTRPEPEALTHSVGPLLRITTELAGPDSALDAARTVTAWATGFIGMELAGAFRLGGDIDRAYEFGITRLAAALASVPAGPA